MGLEDLLRGYTWLHYSRKLKDRIVLGRSAGYFTLEDAKARNMRLITGKEGGVEEEAVVCFYLLIDESDGVIADARFQAYGHTALIGAADSLCALAIGKNYVQAERISFDLLEQELKGKNTPEPFPPEAVPYVHLALSALSAACEECYDIPVTEEYMASPLPLSEISGEGYPGWEHLAFKEKLSVIEKVLDEDIRPYIAMDAGGIQVIGFENNVVKISYQGTCTSCYSATGATLSAIQQLLRAKISPELSVEPDLENLEF